MDNNTTEAFFSADFGKQIAKDLVLSTVMTVGVLAGFVVVGSAANYVQKKIEAKKQSKKAATVAE